MSETTKQDDEPGRVLHENDGTEKDLPSVPGTATRLRRKVAPYLPPPVIAAMQQIDPQLEPILGPEASITIAGTLVVALLVWKLVSLVMGQSSTTSGAIQDEQEDDAIVDYGDVSYDGTVLLCGPPLAGKTSIFYSLVYPTATSSPSFQTVSSIKPNTGFVTKDERVWRYLDTPGHWSPQKLVSTALTGSSSSSVDRIVLVLDSTQPVSKSVDFLYGLLRHFQSKGGSSNNTPSILVACHKTKASKAKNVRRLKLQVRNELERLEKLTIDTDDASPAVDWDDVLSSQVGFVSTSVDPPMLNDLNAYLESGALPSAS
jgi:signal recognition particle receptor subunit beta